MTGTNTDKPSMMDKIKDTVQKVTHTGPHSDNVTTGNTGVHTHAAGTHTHHPTGTGLDHHNTASTGLGTSGTTVGPHSSGAMNKMDPRVDSTGGYGTSGTTGSYGTAGTGAYGTTNTGGLTSGAPTTVGPHSSDTMNKLDPRVDSDLSGTRVGTTGGMTSSTGTHLGGNTSYGATGIGSGNTGYGSSNLAGAPGPAPTTAGPHGSDFLNKVDPRVDSDMSKTTGNPTY